MNTNMMVERRSASETRGFARGSWRITPKVLSPMIEIYPIGDKEQHSIYLQQEAGETDAKLLGRVEKLVEAMGLTVLFPAEDVIIVGASVKQHQ